MDKPILVSVDVIARICDIDVRRVQQLVRKGVLPKVRYGQYDLVECAKAYIRYMHIQTGGPASGTKMDANTEKTRLLAAQADKAELDLAERQGELVESIEVEKRWNKIGANIRTNVIAVASKVAPRCAGRTAPEIQAIVRDEIDDTLEGISTGSTENSG